MTKDYSEAVLIEQPAIELFRELGYETANCFYEKVGDEESTLGRRTSQDVVLVPRLRQALRRLNEDLPAEAIELAIEELKKDGSAVNPVVANREIFIVR
jgi:type I restriction enzyme R subunit